jgi:acetolactate synthase-1/2/3 large subunit
MSAPRHGGDRVAEVLERRGVRTLFTLCGGHISPILVAAKARGLAVIDTRHEADAVFAADATARLTGTVGVAAVTAGPGLTNTATAVQNAAMAQSPVVLLGGATATILKGRGSLQDIDQQALAAPLFKWQASARTVGDLAPLVERALWVAREGVPGPVFVECPVDLLYPEATARAWYGVEPRPQERPPSLAKRLERPKQARSASWRARSRHSAPRSGSPGARAACWEPSTRCSSATAARRRCARRTWCCSPAFPATSASTTDARFRAGRRWSPPTGARRT